MGRSHLRAISPPTRARASDLAVCTMAILRVSGGHSPLGFGEAHVVALSTAVLWLSNRRRVPRVRSEGGARRGYPQPRAGARGAAAQGGGRSPTRRIARGAPR